MPILVNPYRFGVAAATYASLVLANSPLAWYRLNEASGTTFADSSGNARAGTNSGSGAGFTYSVAGLIAGDSDTCLTYTTASCVICAADAALIPKDFAHEFWVKNPGTGTLLRDATTSNGYILDAGVINATFITVRVSGTSFTTTYAHAGLRDGNKHHIVWRVNGTVSDLWIDNTKVWTSAITAAASRTAPATRWYLGRNGTSGAFVGMTGDEWAIYSSLADADVSAHYAAGN